MTCQMVRTEHLGDEAISDNVYIALPVSWGYYL